MINPRICKKPFVIEYRYVGSMQIFRRLSGHWHLYKRYKTQKDRDVAFRQLAVKHKGIHEYRIGDVNNYDYGSSL